MPVSVLRPLSFSPCATLNNVAVREVPGSSGLPLISPILDRVEYFSEGPEKYFRKRIEKYKSTVIRVNVPPGPPIVGESEVVMLLDSKSFPTLFDVSKVEKKNCLTGSFMPSLSFFGGHRVAVYLDPSEENHGKLKNFCMRLIARGSSRFLPEFNKAFDEFCRAVESELAKKGSAAIGNAVDSLLFNFICRTIVGADPVPSLGNSGPTLVKLWLAPQLAPLASSGILPKFVDELTIHSFRLPFFLVSNPYNRLCNFIKTDGKAALVVAKEEGVPTDEAVNDLVFNLGFNAFGGMSILFPSLLKRLAAAGRDLHRRLATEVRDDCAGGITAEALVDPNRLRLARSCVYETLRLDPPVVLQYGRAKQDLDVESATGVYRLRKGQLMAGYQPFATKDPAVFDRAQDFVGARFVEEEARRRLLPYLLWSNGPQTQNPSRNNKQCAGKDFVVMAATLFVANIFLRYNSISVSPDSSSLVVTSLPRSGSPA